MQLYCKCEYEKSFTVNLTGPWYILHWFQWSDFKRDEILPISEVFYLEYVSMENNGLSGLPINSAHKTGWIRLFGTLVFAIGSQSPYISWWDLATFVLLPAYDFMSLLGLYSLSSTTSYQKILWSLEGAKFGFIFFSNRPEIWQAPLQQRCRSGCQIAKRCDHCIFFLF